MSRGNSREATGKFSRLALAVKSSRAPKKPLIVCVFLLDTSGDPFFANLMLVNLPALLACTTLLRVVASGNLTHNDHFLTVKSLKVLRRR